MSVMKSALEGARAVATQARLGTAMRRRARTLAMLARLGAVGAMTVAASPALGQDLSPFATMFQNVLAAVTGPIGVAVATLGLVGTGFGCLFGKLNFAWFGSTFVAVVLIFSAETIVNGFAGAT